jgi:hypothetical protein
MAVSSFPLNLLALKIVWKKRKKYKIRTDFLSLRSLEKKFGVFS